MSPLKRIATILLIISLFSCSTYQSISIHSPLTAQKKYRVTDLTGKKYNVKAEENIFQTSPIIYQRKNGSEKVISRSEIKRLEVRREDYAFRKAMNILLIVGGAGFAALAGLGIYMGTQLQE